MNTGTHPRLHWEGVKTIWGQVYNEHAKEYPDLYDQESSDRMYELDYGMTGFGLAPVKPQGQGAEYDEEVGGAETRYVHVAYALGYMVTWEELKFNKYPEVSARRSRANAFSMNQTIENVATVPYNNAFSTTYFTTWDGKALCATNHDNMSGGSFSNELDPPSDLMESALEDACIQIMGMQNDKGLLINVMPESLHVARQEWFNANRILKSVLQPDSQSNNINVLKATNAFPRGIKMNHYFTAAKPWFIRTNVRPGMKMFWVQKPDLEQDNDFDTRNAKAVSFMMFSVGCTDPRGIFGVEAS
jgi:hypothetical protein